MLKTPFRFEPEFTSEEFQKIGQLSLRWATIEHVLANCLKVMLRLSDEEAVAIVFTQPLERKLQWMRALSELNPLNDDAAKAFEEILVISPIINSIRNNVIHAIVIEDGQGGHVFELRNKGRRLTKEEVFSTEELTNYLAYVVLYFRESLGGKNAYGGVLPPWPSRPEIPDFLRSRIKG